MLLYSKYLKASLRFLKNNRLYTLLNIAGLSAAFATVILITIFLIHEFNTDKHFSNYENLYRLNRGDEVGLAIPFYAYLNHDFSEFDKICRLQPVYSPTLSLEKNHVRTGPAFFADSTVFEFFDLKMNSGLTKDFTLPRTIFISQTLARTLFDSINPLGMTLKQEGREEFTVRGVFEDLPSNSHMEMDFLMPLEDMLSLGENEITQYREFEQWGCTYYIMDRNLIMIDTLDARLNRYIKDVMNNENWQLHIQPFSQIYFDSPEITDGRRHGNRNQLNILLLVAIGIIVIGFANYFNLASATSFSRTREIAIKKAIGVSRKELFFQFILETHLLVLLSVIFGFIIAEAVIPSLNRLYTLSLEVRTLYTTNYLKWVAGIIILLGFLAGSYPGMVLSGMNVLSLFRKGLHSKRNGVVARTIFIVLQYTVTTILVVGVITINKQVKYMVNLDPGFTKEQLIYLSYGEEVAETFQSLKTRLLQNPDIVGISQTANVPGQTYWQNLVDIEGERLIFYDCIADPSFAEVMGLEMIEGDFIKEGSPVNQRLVLNEAAVELLELEEPIGYEGIWGIPVVGVIEDFNFQSMHSEIKPMMIRYVPFSQYAIVRIGPGKIKETLESIIAEWEEFFPDHPIEYHFFDQEFETLYLSEIRFGKLISVFSIIAMLISCIGLFGLTSYISRKSAAESGIKAVFGASSMHLFGFYLLRMIKWQVVAIGIGIITAWFILDLWLEKFAYRCSIPVSGIILTIVAILCISFLTVLYHTLKIANQNPVDVIRNE